jgi:mitochondrial fission process protein 1
MAGPSSPETQRHVDAILARYDKNRDAKLSKEEVDAIIDEYEKRKETLPPDVLAALKHYDADADGKLDVKVSSHCLGVKFGEADTVGVLNVDVALPQEIDQLHEDLSASRYVAYAAVAARAARYLAFTSDVGEAFRPVVKPFLVTASYGISWLYCLGDVAYSSHQQAQKGVEGMDLIRYGTERAVFQAVASMGVPALLIHSQVKVVQRVTARYRVGQRWGPTVAGLAVIPFLPVILDEPAEKGIEWVFHKLWPKSSRH